MNVFHLVSKQNPASLPPYKESVPNSAKDSFTPAVLNPIFQPPAGEGLSPLLILMVSHMIREY